MRAAQVLPNAPPKARRKDERWKRFGLELGGYLGTVGTGR